MVSRGGHPEALGLWFSRFYPDIFQQVGIELIAVGEFSLQLASVFKVEGDRQIFQYFFEFRGKNRLVKSEL